MCSPTDMNEYRRDRIGPLWTYQQRWRPRGYLARLAVRGVLGFWFPTMAAATARPDSQAASTLGRPNPSPARYTPSTCANAESEGWGGRAAGQRLAATVTAASGRSSSSLTAASTSAAADSIANRGVVCATRTGAPSPRRDPSSHSVVSTG